MAKKKILFIFKLPPPFNGATFANKNIHESNLLHDSFKVKFINYGLTRSGEQFGKFKTNKVFFYLKALFRFLVYIQNVHIVYITIAPIGIGFLKDSVFIVLSKLFKKKIIIHLHGKGIKKQYIKSKFWEKYYPFVINGCDVICLSNLLKNDLPFFNKSPFVVPNGIKTTDYTKIFKINEEFQFLYLSNLYKTKGVLDFIDSMILLKDETELKFSATLVGAESPELSYKEVKKYITNKKGDKFINLIGPLYGNEKKKILKNSDVFIFPTYYANEAFPIVILEAMESGLPIITTSEGGIPDLVTDKQNGFIVKARDIKSITEKAKRLLENKELREKISKQNIEKFYASYTITHFEKNIKKVIEEVI